MREAVTILFTRVVVGVLVAAGLIGLLLGRMRRRLRVAPDQPTRAPVLWLVNLTGDARLHRRMRSLAGRARQLALGGSRSGRSARSTVMQRIAHDVVAELVALDSRLVESTALGYDEQRVVLAALRDDVKRVSSLLDRLEIVAGRSEALPTGVSGADSLDELEARVERLEVTASSAGIIDTDGRPTRAGTSSRPPALGSSE